MAEPDIAAKRLPKEAYALNFADLNPPLSAHEALVESDRCYFCYEAPCMQACPTAIDIPLFIRQIMAGNPKGAAKTIFSENILGGMCARDRKDSGHRWGGACGPRLCSSPRDAWSPRDHLRGAQEIGRPQ